MVAAVAATGFLTLAGAALAENYQYRFTKGDSVLAAQIVHRPSAKGWTGGAVKPDLSPDPVRCAGYYAPRQSDLVVTGDKESHYTYKTGQELDTDAVVFGSAAMAEVDWRRGNNQASYFRCLRATWPSLVAPGTKIVSLAPLSMPRVGTHLFAYRLVFGRSGSRIAIDSINVARGRVEVEIDQIAQDPSAADLADMKTADRLLTSEMGAKLNALG